jgi:Trk K+ transport system NAD-binding subunit/mannitol/fructose-specific phosphotransferase system IIA component (Ntr-type)
VFEILLAPLLICMIGSFLTINFSAHRPEFSKILHDIGPPVYVAFFTLTGASLELDILVEAWPIAVALFLVRIVAIFLGSFWSGTLAGAPMSHNRISWMAYVTQAGLGLGLAKEVVVEFPGWGTTFATVMISIIVLNQITGPPLFKWAIRRAGEAHSRADTPVYVSDQRAIIFGLEGQSLALARMLRSHHWQVKIASRKASREEVAGSEVEIVPIPDLTLEAMQGLEADQAEAIITMLSDDENHRICELAFEHFGTENLIVRLNHRANFNRFHELGALVVDPTTAIVSLLDHFVRSPSAASLLLGMDADQDIVELEIRNPDLDGLTLRDLRLPLDCIVLGVRRKGHLLVSHGYTRLEVGDQVTVVGSMKNLEEVALKFDTNRENALLHLIEKVTAKELSTPKLETEVQEIIRETDTGPRDRFDRYIEESLILDIERAMGVEEFFKLAAGALSPRLKIDPATLCGLLMEREKESSTAISPGLAIPHIIIDGEHPFRILMARCREGIRFSEAAPMVHAVFVLAGTRGERNFHLRALSAIAQIVQDPNFERRWLRARSQPALREVILRAERRRHG